MKYWAFFKVCESWVIVSQCETAEQQKCHCLMYSTVCGAGVGYWHLVLSSTLIYKSALQSLKKISLFTILAFICSSSCLPVESRGHSLVYDFNDFKMILDGMRRCGFYILYMSCAARVNRPTLVLIDLNELSAFIIHWSSIVSSATAQRV